MGKVTFVDQGKPKLRVFDVFLNNIQRLSLFSGLALEILWKNAK